MRSRSLIVSMVVFTALAVAGVIAITSTGNTPILGLDLRGGVSAILAPTEPASAGDLEVIRDLIRDDLESRGIAEPDVRVEGANVVVDLPGIDNQEEAFQAVQVAGIVTLRPVLACQPNPDAVTATTGPADESTGESIGSVPATTAPAGDEESTASRAPSAGRSPFGRGAVAATPTTVPPTEPATSEPPASEPVTSEPPTNTVPSSTPDSVPSTTPISVPPTAPPVAGPPAPTTTVPFGQGDGVETLPTADDLLLCAVGPVGTTGEVFARDSASVGIDQQNGQWIIGVDLRDDRVDEWNNLAAQCNPGLDTCPTRQLAIVLDGVIQSAPTVNEPSFPGGTVQISGAFEEDEARTLARTLNRGAFPVDIETQRLETVSASAGTESLRAAVIAGLIGIGVMLALMVVRYRKLAIIIIGGLTVWALAVYALAAYVSHATNYALSLAGATGIIVAVGITADTYIVLFERIRDELRNGRTLFNAAPRAFKSTWRTIVAADLVSLIASVILFVLSVGSVKGFALYLGLTTICDLLVCWFVVRPATLLLSRSRWFSSGTVPIGATIGATS